MFPQIFAATISFDFNAAEEKSQRKFFE